MESDTGLLLLCQRAVPIDDLGLEFHLTPGHSTNAISPPRYGNHRSPKSGRTQTPCQTIGDFERVP